MDPTLSTLELMELVGVLPSPRALDGIVYREARRVYLCELKEHLRRLRHEIDSNIMRGAASIEVPVVWLDPIEEVLVSRGLAYALKMPPAGTNMAAVTVRWTVDSALTPVDGASAPQPKRKRCGKTLGGFSPNGRCNRLYNHRGACET